MTLTTTISLFDCSYFVNSLSAVTKKGFEHDYDTCHREIRPLDRICLTRLVEKERELNPVLENLGIPEDKIFNMVLLF